MTTILVTHYNIIVKARYYLKRWRKILFVILEKEKALIEAVFQFMMRIFLNEDNEEKIEEDDRFLKLNYRSRKNY